MASNAQLLLIAKARRRRAEAQGGASVDPTAEPTQAATGMTEPVNAQPPSLIDHIMGGLDYASKTGGIMADRALGGAAAVAGLPVDAINASPMLANLIPGVHGVGPMTSEPVGGSEWLNELRRGFGVIPPSAPPSDALQSVLGRVAEEVGSAAVPVGGTLAAAARTSLPALREAGGMAKYLLEPAVVDPAKYVGKEVAAATAAGTGAGVAHLIPGAGDRSTPGGQAADILGAIFGVGATSLGKKVGGSVGNIFNAVRQNPNYIDDTVKNAVVDRIATAADLPGAAAGKAYDTDPLIERIMSGVPGRERPSAVIPGFQESLADRTGDPGLAAFEYSRQSGPNAGEFTRRRGDNSQAVDTAMSAVAPQATPGAFRSALDDERAARLSAAEQGTQGAQSDFDRYLQNLQPQMGAEDRGSTVRSGITNAERAARESEAAVWQGVNGQVDPAPLADTLDDTRAGLTQARQQRIADLGPTADIPRQFAPRELDENGVPVDGPTPSAPPVDIAEINDMRSTLLEEQRKAQSGPQADRNRANAIGKLLDDVNTYLGSDAVPADVRARTDVARGVSRDVNERFNRPNDPIAAALSTKEGRPDLPDSAVASSFIRPDAAQASNIDRLLAETDLSSQARPVRAALRDEILAGVDKAKALTDPARLRTYLDQFSTVFDRFPDLRTEIEGAAGAGERLGGARASETALQKDLGTPDGTVKGRGVVGKYLQHSDANSERAINEVLNSKDPGKAADELLTTVGNRPAAVEGARAAFWNKLKSESQSVDNSQRTMSGSRAWRGDWLKSFLDKPATAAVAERLYRDHPEHLAAIRRYADVLDNVDLRQRGKAVGTSGTAQGVNPVLSPETLQSRFYAYMQGRVGGTYLVTSIAAVMARRAVRNAQGAAIERLTDKVLLNPDLAAALLKDNNPANRAALARKAKGWLGNEAASLLDMVNGDDKHNDPTVDAVMRGGPEAPAKPLSLVVRGATPKG